MKYNQFIYKTAVGDITIAGNSEALTRIDFGAQKGPEEFRPSVLTDLAAKQLNEYLAGKRCRFDLPLQPKGTVFQLKVWDALRTIPYGETRSYKQIAEMIGSPKACRAVGMANHHNPIAIVIPCHRVIGSNGSLVGYGAGLPVKRFLLSLEKGMEFHAEKTG